MSHLGHVLITGAGGFLAAHTVPVFLEQGWRVTGLRRSSAHSPWPAVPMLHVDLDDGEGRVRDVLKPLSPDAIVHLAADVPADRRSSAWSWLEHNARATDNLLTAAADAGVPRVVVMSSGAVYGGGAPGEMFTEDSPMNPATSYGVSKVLIEALACRAASALGLPVIRLRLFNVTGPGEPAHLALGGLARQTMAAMRGERDAIVAAGDLTTERDLLDVRDAGSAIVAATLRGRVNAVYNIASGESTAIADVIRRMQRAAGSRHDVRTSAASPDPIRSQRGDASRLAADTGWRPRRTLDDAIGALIAGLEGQPALGKGPR